MFEMVSTRERRNWLNPCIAGILPPFGRQNDEVYSRSRQNDGAYSRSAERGSIAYTKSPMLLPLYGESHRAPRLKYFLPFLSGYQVEGRNPDNVGWGLSY